MRYDCPDVVRDCVLMKMDFPTERLCAADEWPTILNDWCMGALFNGDIDRYFRLDALRTRLFCA